MDIEDMINKIERYIDMYDGTMIGRDVKNRLDNADSSDYDEISDLYYDIFGEECN